MTIRRLTHHTLLRLGACEDQRELFRSLCDAQGGVDVSVALCLEHADKFVWRWAAANLLSPQAWSAFRAAVISAQAAYCASIAPAWADYEAATAPILARLDCMEDYAAATASMRDTFISSVAPARADYEAALARAFAEAYIGDVNARPDKPYATLSGAGDDNTITRTEARAQMHALLVWLAVVALALAPCALIGLLAWFMFER